MKLFMLAATLAAALAAFAAPAGAHFATGVYTHNGCPGNRVDPVNFVFYDNAYGGRTVNQIQYHACWTNTSGSTQYFYSHDTCSVMDAQRASGCGACSRYHIRLNNIHYDTDVGYTAVGDAHHEDFVWYCGHAVDSNGSNGSGFDQGRRALRTAFSNAGHSWSSVYWGNTQNFQQCDGDYAASDGWVVWMHVHAYFH
jgi:hypothetical protein